SEESPDESWSAFGFLAAFFLGLGSAATSGGAWNSGTPAVSGAPAGREAARRERFLGASSLAAADFSLVTLSLAFPESEESLLNLLSDSGLSLSDMTMLLIRPNLGAAQQTN